MTKQYRQIRTMTSLLGSNHEKADFKSDQCCCVKQKRPARGRLVQTAVELRTEVSL